MTKKRKYCIAVVLMLIFFTEITLKCKAVDIGAVSDTNIYSDSVSNNNNDVKKNSVRELDLGEYQNKMSIGERQQRLKMLVKINR